ncbi:MAG: MYG1 family protein [Candidatus Nomurabacteria bacterium]|nr:MYG1 family protein [Candidatus Nomurabacteria bacterium]
MRNKKTKKLVTHNGKFHSDDIFACAVLSLVLEKENHSYEVIRTRDIEIIKEGDYVFDVGGVYDPDNNRFDHHQLGGAGKHENGIDYASFGLVWKKYGIVLCSSQEVVDDVDNNLASPVDAEDNGLDLYIPNFKGVLPYAIWDVFRSFMPTWKEDENMTDSIFPDMVDIAKKILLREIKKSEDKLEAKVLVEKTYENAVDKRLIILDHYYPWRKALMQHPEPVFVVTPRQGGKWDLHTVNVSTDSFKARKDLPESWGGLLNKDLQKVTGVPEAIFCHRGLFLAVANSKEGILKLAELALNS